eukprot:m.87956 g.87956  ORF g.87956 m.87956 type:complete len:258 (+) comp14521_c2_seq1:989-1762(+)
MSVLSSVSHLLACRAVDSLAATFDACIVLNHQLPRDTLRFLNAARVVIACDGGANLLRRSYPSAPLDAIVGDMDSVTPATLGHYSQAEILPRPCQIVNMESDQDTTDLEKALMFYYDTYDKVDEQPMPPQRRPVIAVLGSLAGRLDHAMQQLNVGLKQAERARLVFVSDESCAEVLRPGFTEMHLQPGQEGPACGLIPFGTPVRGTTTGLRWNLEPTEDLELKWGGLISTSNLVEKDVRVVTFDMKQPVLWTIERFV